MKRMIGVIGVGLLCFTSVVVYGGAQQDKMKACNATAKEKALKGSERKMFMKDCLSKKADAAAENSAVTPKGKKAAR